MITRRMFWTINQVDTIPFHDENMLSLFKFEGITFLYIETENNIPIPDCWFEMFDIYHNSRPRDKQHWQRKNKNSKPRLRVNYLKPEKVSSYVFYHYQMQEEQKKANREKYNCIFLSGNMIVMYTEEPREIDEFEYDGKLLTNNTPWENWLNIMKNHFLPWENREGDWQETELIFYRR